MLRVANLTDTKLCKNWNPVAWVLIWEHSARTILWIPTWQGLDVFQKSLLSCALDESSLSIGRVNYNPSILNVQAHWQGISDMESLGSLIWIPPPSLFPHSTLPLYPSQLTLSWGVGATEARLRTSPGGQFITIAYTAPPLDVYLQQTERRWEGHSYPNHYFRLRPLQFNYLSCKFFWKRNCQTQKKKKKKEKSTAVFYGQKTFFIIPKWLISCLQSYNSFFL